ncbi:MAG: hypothetical protein ACI4U4_04115 [Bacilli bacterium]
MKEKIIKLNDFKFTFGQPITCLNVFSAFGRRKNCNKYIIYSYVNQKRSSLEGFVRYYQEERYICKVLG